MTTMTFYLTLTVDGVKIGDDIPVKCELLVKQDGGEIHLTVERAWLLSLDENKQGKTDLTEVKIGHNPLLWWIWQHLQAQITDRLNDDTLLSDVAREQGWRWDGMFWRQEREDSDG